MPARSLRFSVDFQVDLTEAWQIVAWVGATSALLAPPDSCLGVFELSA
jgi:hypothetical protein